MCLAGSALCSGLTLGFFSLGRVRLQLLAQQGDVYAKKVLKIR